jgi:hypothetical protein
MVRLRQVNEQSSARYTGTLKDENGTIVPASALTTLVLTLYDKVTGAVINGRNLQNVLNASGVTVYDTLQSGVDQDGNAISYNLLWAMSPADNAIVTDANATEVHIAVFQGTFGTGKALTHDLAITVRNLRLT